MVVGVQGTDYHAHVIAGPVSQHVAMVMIGRYGYVTPICKRIRGVLIHLDCMVVSVCAP